jgi:phosphogluconate dehydratase
VDSPKDSLDKNILRPASDPFAVDGGLRTVTGNLGQAVVKVSSVQAEHRVITAPARVFDDQQDFLAAFSADNFDGDLVAVLRYQGPAANGMPELHSLTPALGVLQDRGYQVALVTDGRMSGASGKIPAAIHLTPEAAAGGPIAKIHDGDIITLDTNAGTLVAHVTEADLENRQVTGHVLTPDEWVGTGRELFASMRAAVSPADQGASVFSPNPRGEVSVP